MPPKHPKGKPVRVRQIKKGNKIVRKGHWRAKPVPKAERVKKLKAKHSKLQERLEEMEEATVTSSWDFMEAIDFNESMEANVRKQTKIEKQVKKLTGKTWTPVW